MKHRLVGDQLRVSLPRKLVVELHRWVVNRQPDLGHPHGRVVLSEVARLCGVSLPGLVASPSIDRLLVQLHTGTSLDKGHLVFQWRPREVIRFSNLQFTIFVQDYFDLGCFLIT